MEDVIIIGGSYAGLSAALQLGRARRRVLVIDAGQRRNRFAASSHGFLTRDGASPALLHEQGKAEVLAYPTVGFREGLVSEMRRIEGGFAVRVGDEELRAKRLILATGVVDELPAVPGLAERWGRSVFACPYCHGYELQRGRLGVLATNPLSLHHAALVAEWGAEGETTFFVNDAFEPDADALAQLAARKIKVERARVVEASGDAPRIALTLHDGSTLQLDGLFVMARTRVHTQFAEQLGCELESGPTGSFFKTDPMRETTVPGVFACGDIALPAGAVALAVADGVRAGTAAHRSLVFG
jgi:thioredoxin reductase